MLAILWNENKVHAFKYCKAEKVVLDHKRKYKNVFWL